MPPIRCLKAAELRRRCDALSLSSTAEEAPEKLGFLGQERALEALSLGFSIARPGYNIYAAGPNGVGKRALVQRLLGEMLSEALPPDDWCYVHRFEEEHRPRALRLPAGRAAPLAAAVSALVEQVDEAMHLAFESRDYRARRQQLETDLARRQSRALQEVEIAAAADSVLVTQVDGDFTLTALQDGKELAATEFKQLPAPRREELDAAMERVSQNLREMLERYHGWEREVREARSELDQCTATEVAQRLLQPVRDAYAAESEVLEHLTAIERDLVSRAHEFSGKHADEGSESQLLRQLGAESVDSGAAHRRYEVNVLVDHARTRGKPIVYEDNPSHQHLVGRVEYRARFGSQITDYRRIVGGALHRARGGVLLLDVVELLERPQVFRTLERILKSGEIRVEPPEEGEGNATTPWLAPDPVPLGDTKIVLLGDESVYYQLCAADPDFPELFKVIAEFDDRVDWNRETQAEYVRVLYAIASKEGLLEFAASGMASIVEYASRSTEDSHKLSIRMRPIVDLMIEAEREAQRQQSNAVEEVHVEAAIQAQERRRRRRLDESLEAQRRGIQLIDCEGHRMGQVNGLSVSFLGEIGLGNVTRISARVRIGRGDLLDVERESALGGPIHSKGVMLITGFLGARYAIEVPLSLSASIAFEQSYGPVEGDSASLAEICALLSALAELPASQALAVTGSINQYGEVQAVGGVNEKIEGFFDACRDRGLTGKQGVIIPTSNVQSLMLRKDVVEAVASGRFRVLAVQKVDDALEALLGHPAGQRNEEGCFPPGSVNAAVEARLVAFAEVAQRFARGRE